jgi:hypothetical protein
MKRTNSLLTIVFLAAVACGPIDERDSDQTGSRHASTQQAAAVELLHASSLPYSYRGPCTQPTVFDVLVSDLGQNKQVLIHKTDSAGSWESLEAAYVSTLKDGRQRYQAKKSFSCYDFDFYVEYKVGGQSHYDSNGGNNYRIGVGSNLAGHLLPHGRQVLAPSAGSVAIYDYTIPSGPVFKRVLNLNVVLANSGHPKKLEIVYSGNGANTATQRLAGSFVNGYRPHTYSEIQNPSGLGTEVWRFGTMSEQGVDLASLGKDVTRVDYVLEYEVNGKKVVDDNFGQKYSVAVPLYGKVLLRGSFGENGWEPYHYMQRMVDDKYQVYHESTVVFENRGRPDRFKFDLKGDWSLTYGENDNGGRSKSGVAEQGGGDIIITEGTGRYRIRFWEVSKKFTVERMPDNYKRTVVMIKGTTSVGQDMFIRGGIDHDYAKKVLGLDCKANRYHCMIPIRHRNWANDTTADWKQGDYNLDWHGKEYSQGYNAPTEPEGTPLDWTTNAWPASWGAKKSYDVDGYGEFSLNTYGHHYWVLDVDMDCSKTVNGWFELKSYISNGPGWEDNVSQPNTPYASINHFAECGKINVFERGVSQPIAIRDF